MGEVIEIDNHRPHLVIDARANALQGERPTVHVVPVALAIEWARGTKPLPEPDILRHVITEWLAALIGEFEPVYEDGPRP